MIKNNIGLACYALNMVGKHYVLGTNCRVLTNDTYNNLMKSKSQAVQKWLARENRKAVVKSWIGQVVTDCHGLIEGYLNDDNENGVVERGEGTFDTYADDMFNQAKEKGNIKTIDKYMPGICVRYKGHVGVYIGNGKVVEARGFDHGVCVTKLTNRPWTHWYKHPLISYDPKVSMPAHDIIKTSPFEDIIWLQWRVGAIADGQYGPKTAQAYKAFANFRGWNNVTGYYVGKNGRKALCK